MLPQLLIDNYWDLSQYFKENKKGPYLSADPNLGKIKFAPRFSKYVLMWALAVTFTV